MLWLGEQRGYLVDWLTQRWVCLTGRRVDVQQDAWLDGAVGHTRCIGKDFFEQYASGKGWLIRRDDPNSGLVQDFEALAQGSFDPARVQPGVRDFYEHTARYEMDAWAQWSGIFYPFGRLVAGIFSRRLQQLNVPLTGLDTSHGINSEVIQFIDPATQRIISTAWIRQLIGTGNLLYAGSYSTCRVPGYPGLCIRVVFPLPNGNGMVILKPVLHEDGSLSVVSHGEKTGDPGFYFNVHLADGRLYSRYVQPMRESIHVYQTPEGDVRADHVLKLWNWTFLRLHYRLREKIRHAATVTA